MIYVNVREEILKGMLKYYIFCVKWLWRNRDLKNTRQKFKAMECVEGAK